MRPKHEKIIIEASIGNEPSQIGKGETGSTLHHMLPFGIGVDMVGVNPASSSGHHAKVEVILDCMGIAGLAFPNANLLFDLFS